MEACSGAHFWGRQFIGLGHTVRLISPQYVKAFVRGQKNDRNDAEAVCEAASRPAMRSVAVKSADQQQILAFHRSAAQATAQKRSAFAQISDRLYTKLTASRMRWKHWLGISGQRPIEQNSH